MIFKCKHKFSDLIVYSDSTEKDNKDYPKDYKDVIHHLYCNNCETKLDLGYVKYKRNPIVDPEKVIVSKPIMIREDFRDTKNKRNE